MSDSGESLDVSVCRTINMTDLSICQLHDSTTCQPQCDSTWNSICPSVYLSSVLSVQPSAKFMVKIPTRIPVGNFLNTQYLGKLLSVHKSSDLSFHPSGSLSITSSLSAEHRSKFPSNHGEKNMVNYLHKILVESPFVCTSCITSVSAPVHGLSIPSVHPSDNKHQEIQDE